MKKDFVKIVINFFEGNNIPLLKIIINKFFSPQTAYQMTSILEGVVERGTEKTKKFGIYKSQAKLVQQIIIPILGLLIHVKFSCRYM